MYYRYKFLSEALIFTLTNPQYDNRLFIESLVQYMKIPSSEHVVYTNCFFVFVLIFRTIYVHNMFWAWNFHVLNWWFNEQSFVILWVSWGKIQVRISASEKDLPVCNKLFILLNSQCRNETILSQISIMWFHLNCIIEASIATPARTHTISGI